MLKTVCFFMIVTDRDMLIAKYAIKSFKKLVTPLANRYLWRLCIYANCLSPENKKTIAEFQKKYSFIDVHDNIIQCDSVGFLPGTRIFSDDGGIKSLKVPMKIVIQYGQVNSEVLQQITGVL